MTSKVRLKLGQLEVECEGTEEFLKDELPKLLETFSKLQPTVPADEAHVGGSNGSTTPANGVHKTRTGSMTQFASRLGCKTASDLTKAALLYLHLVERKDLGVRKDILAAMKKAASVYNKNMESNFKQTMRTLLKAKAVNEPRDREYTLTDDVRAELIAKLDQT